MGQRARVLLQVWDWEPFGVMVVPGVCAAVVALMISAAYYCFAAAPTLPQLITLTNSGLTATATAITAPDLGTI